MKIFTYIEGDYVFHRFLGRHENMYLIFLLTGPSHSVSKPQSFRNALSFTFEGYIFCLCTIKFLSLSRGLECMGVGSHANRLVLYLS
jgi:hypothetical protein